MAEKTTYKDSGVDKEAGYRAVKLMKEHVKKTFTQGVISDLGGFSGMFSLDKECFEHPVLVAGTDGVGTKLILAFMTDTHNTIGQDCVAMCANDILCQGAKPLFFLDYIATGKLNPEKSAQIVEGIACGCEKAGAALIGGETAEMPGMYKTGEYDIAGFCVGIVDKTKIIDGSGSKPGNVLIGLPSSGVHSNGFSLVRKIFFEKNNISPDKYFDEIDNTLAKELLKPTQIYVKPVLKMLKHFNIKGMSHITGGGFYENIPRMLPDGLMAKIHTKNIPHPPIFDLIQKYGNVDQKEMYSTFNMGIGFVLVVDMDDSNEIINQFGKIGQKAHILGKIIEGKQGIELCHD